MDLDLLKKLIRIVERSSISEFAVEEGELKVKISKNSHANSTQTIIREAQPGQPQINQPENKPAQKEETKSSEENIHEIRSPIVGTFYRSPAPDADPYIQVGNSITQGSVLCIVEAMKLMNEIESDVSGKIIKILVENGTPVEYNQPLFLVQPE